MRDFDRILDETGCREANRMGKAMADRALTPDVILCSTAQRTKQTLDEIGRHIPIADRTRYTDKLYASDAPDYLELASAVVDAQSVLIVGHNPMLEDLAIGLSTSGDDEAISELNMGFRTAGLAVIDFDGPPATFNQSGGFLTLYLTPADL